MLNSEQNPEMSEPSLGSGQATRKPVIVMHPATQKIYL